MSSVFALAFDKRYNLQSSSRSLAVYTLSSIISSLAVSHHHSRRHHRHLDLPFILLLLASCLPNTPPLRYLRVRFNFNRIIPSSSISLPSTPSITNTPQERPFITHPSPLLSSADEYVRSFPSATPATPSRHFRHSPSSPANPAYPRTNVSQTPYSPGAILLFRPPALTYSSLQVPSPKSA